MIDDIETPALIVNEQVALNNIRKYQDHCNAVGLALRPHIKTHKTVRFSREQIAAGAVGITCQKISEASIMAQGGISDILITFNIWGEAKLSRLRTLAEKVEKLQVTADNEPVIRGLSTAFSSAAKPLGVMVECDTGAGRCGVQSAEGAVELAKIIAESPGLSFSGLMTYPAPGGAKNVVEFMRKAKDLLEQAGIACPTISSGGSPDMWSAETSGIVTEYRIGTYIFNDSSLVARGACDLSDCAAKVLATVVSLPAKGRAIIDAGSKVMTSDTLGLEGFGLVVGHPDIKFTQLSEEHGTLEGATDKLKIGDRVSIIPNHICVVVNMFDTFWLQNSAGEFSLANVDARGLIT
ncbi:MAG: alanine racemase [Rhizobiales bacterium]|nr:alanine racemase [Hyphomicrobiales bacterium]